MVIERLELVAMIDGSANEAMRVRRDRGGLLVVGLIQAVSQSSLSEMKKTGSGVWSIVLQSCAAQAGALSIRTRAQYDVQSAIRVSVTTPDQR